MVSSGSPINGLRTMMSLTLTAWMSPWWRCTAARTSRKVTSPAMRPSSSTSSAPMSFSTMTPTACGIGASGPMLTNPSPFSFRMSLTSICSSCDSGGVLYDAAFHQGLYLLLIVSESGQNFPRMLAQCRSEPARAAGRGGELGHHSRHLHRPTARQLRFLDHAARTVVQVAHDVGDVVDLARRHVGAIEHAQHLLQVVRGAPVADHLFEFFGALDPAVVFRERGIVGEVLASYGRHHALENRIAVGTDHDVFAVAGGIGVGGNDARKRRAAAVAHEAADIVFRQQTFHEAEHRLVERDVHHLAATAVDFPAAQRHQRAERTVQRRDRIAQADSDPHRRAIGIAGNETQASHRLADGAEAGAVAVRPVLPVAGKTHQDQP